MWPKALAQLLELAPHVTRLVPVADRYLQSRTEGRDAQRVAYERLADGLRVDIGNLADGVHGDLTQLAAAQAGIAHQLNQHSETLASMAAELRTARLTGEELETRMKRMEARTSQLWMALIAALVLLVAVEVMVVFVMLHMRQYIHGS